MMNKKVLILVGTLLVFLLSGTVLAAQPNLVQDTGGIEVSKGVTIEISHEDTDWPITRIERHQGIDPETKEVTVHTTIVRESPPTYQPPNERLLSCIDTPSLSTVYRETSLLACTWQGTTSKTDSVTVGSITSHAKHYADRYCQPGCLPNWYKPYKLEVWWTRTNSNWNAQNATVIWGCGNCDVCNGGTVYQVYNDGPYTPTWQSSTLSHYVVYTSSTFEIFQGAVNPPNGIVDSDAYDGPTYKGHMKAITPLP